MSLWYWNLCEWVWVMTFQSGAEAELYRAYHADRVCFVVAATKPTSA